ncbi:hypothetical protein AtDm6_1659 [Acetobacter tropicalis]|uniref:Uncharacterized protein n=1 Tax=Acetobacter tropicalis TaxID=104102 RepID=A0A094YRY4_9PROT|nr:hypothetical protein AtDm6_1659 [Acetobacter tropicalis]
MSFSDLIPSARSQTPTRGKGERQRGPGTGLTLAACGRPVARPSLFGFVLFLFS